MQFTDAVAWVREQSARYPAIPFYVYRATPNRISCGDRYVPAHARLAVAEGGKVYRVIPHSNGSKGEEIEATR